MVTIKDVAKMAGLSLSTTSNAINGKYGVKKETRQRVLEVAKKLNYVPNRIAQSLVTNITRDVNVILSGPNSIDIITNPAFVEIIKAITVTLAAHQYRVILNICDSEEENEILHQLGHNRASDAVILVVTNRNDEELLNLVDKIPVPVVLAGRSLAHDIITSVTVNNKKVGYLATQHLIKSGHLRIGFIGAFPGFRVAEERLRGYREALEGHGIQFDESLVVLGNYNQISGFMGARQLLRQSSHLPDAIFAANDVMAMGVLECLLQEGIRVPADMSLIGCDNIPNLHLLNTPLSSIAVPYNEIGRIAAMTVIQALENHEFKPQTLQVEPELRIRSSIKDRI